MNSPVDQRHQWELMKGANRLIVELFKRPTWTIAMGAMLVSGLRPVPGCTKVPDEAVWLLDETRPATPRQLRAASNVVAEWIEDREDEESEWVAPPAECSPLEFLEWCDDTYQGSPRTMRPEWLDYLVSLTEVPSPSAPQLGSSIEMTERLLKLEHIADVVGQSVVPRLSTMAAVADSPLPTSTADAHYVARTQKLIDNNEIKAVYALAVAAAQDGAMNPFDVDEILDALIDMADDKRWKYALRLERSQTTASVVLQAPRGTRWTILDKNRLQLHLNRIHRKLTRSR